MVSFLIFSAVLVGLSQAQDAGSSRANLHERVLDSITFPPSAMCKTGTPAYFYVENAGIDDSIARIYKGVTEEECLTMCTDSKDLRKHVVFCSSLNYKLSSRTCSINRRQAVPRGTEKLKDLNGTIYYEKFCLSTKAPVTCGEGIFPRLPQAVLVGSALSVKKVEDISACGALCAETPACQSAMFYQNGTECIMNIASAINKPELVQPETKEAVEYFENGCRDQVKEVLRKVKASSKPRSSAAVSSSDNGSDNFTPWSEFSPCDHESGFKFRTRKCLSKTEEKCKGKLVEALACGKASPSSTGLSDGWSDWSSECTPLEPAECVGIQRRVCKGLPSHCDGPSTKYCFLPGCGSF